MRIAGLETTVAAQLNSIQQSEEKLANMRSELLLREDNYNKTFSNGGAGQRALAVDKAMTAQQVNILCSAPFIGTSHLIISQYGQQCFMQLKGPLIGVS